jgi:hypothetical protein
MMVFFAPVNGTSAVNLLGKDETNQLMGEHQFGKLPHKIGPFPKVFIYPKRPSNEEMHPFGSI